jgi:nucleoside-diphosphate-sugar epimerase
MSVVLLTGASGFIGYPLILQLLEQGHQVHATTSRPPESWTAQPGLNWHRIDLLAGEADIQALCRSVVADHLIHLAWCVAPGNYWITPDNLRWVIATQQLVSAFHAHGGRHAVLAGTCAEYDWCQGLCREDITPLAPATPYGRSKRLVQEWVTLFGELQGLNVAWARIFHLFGPREAETRLVPSVIHALMKGEAALCSSGEQWRDFLHVKDVAAAFVELSNQEATGVFNVGSGEPVQLKTVIAYLARSLQAEGLVRLGARKASENDPAFLVSDSRRLRALGWRPSFSLHDGLDDSLSWWRPRLLIQ